MADDKDILRDIVRELMQENNTAGGGNNPALNLGNPPAAAPIELNVNGQAVKFGSKDELEAQLNQALLAARTQREQLQAQIEELTAGAAKPAPVADTFDSKKFLEEFGEDPRTALKSLLNDVIFEGKAPDPGAVLRASVAEQEDMRKGLVVQQFLAIHPEFQTGQQGQIVKQIQEQTGLPFDVSGLEAAYGIAIARNLVPPPQIAQQQFQQQQQQQFQQASQQSQGGYPFQQQQGQFPPQAQGGFQLQQGPDPRAFNGGMNFTPPSFGRGPNGVAPPDWLGDAENLSPEQIEQIFARAGRLR